MSFDPLTAVFELGKTAIEKIWPDPAKRAKELFKLEQLKQSGNLAELNAHVQLMLGQMKINEESAKHKSVFVAGARPFIIWVGGFALAYQFLIYPLLLWIVAFMVISGLVLPKGFEPPPVMDATLLFSLVQALLGVAAMRSYDKNKGTETNSIKGR